MKLKLKNVRLSFPQLFVPKGIRQADGTMSDPKYNASFLFGRDHPQFKEISDAIVSVAKEKWPTTWQVHVKAAKAQDKLPIHDGDLKTYAGYAGNVFLTAGSKNPPDCRDADPSIRLGASNAGRLYGGCYVTAIVSLWAQDNQWGKRVNCELLGVQFVRDGDAFRAGETTADDDFEDLSTEDTGAGVGAADDDSDSLI